MLLLFARHCAMLFEVTAEKRCPILLEFGITGM